MKRVAVLLLTVFIIFSFCACTKDKQGQVVTGEKYDVGEVADTSDYDENGDFIFTSNADRVVVPNGSSYWVFKFCLNALGEMLIVTPYEDEAAAQAAFQDKIEAESGDILGTQYSNVVIQDNLIIFTVGLFDESFGYLYTVSRDVVEADMGITYDTTSAEN